MASRKILSQAGQSLADVYDIEGSVVGLERLDVSEIQGVHDIGPQIHSERLNAFHRRITSSAELQNQSINSSLSGIPDCVNRILSVSMIADAASRISFASIAIADPSSAVEHIIWAWDDVNDVEGPVRWDDGTGATVVSLLRATHGPSGANPNLLLRTGASWRMPILILRALTSAFGAGTVTLTAGIQLARPDRSQPTAGEPSSHGLPIPGW